MQISRKGFLRGLGVAAVAGGSPLSGFDMLSRAVYTHGVSPKATTVTGVELLPFTLPKKVPERTALGLRAGSDGVFVRLTTAEGVAGLGEASPNPAVMGETAATDLVMGKTLGQIVKGRDAFAIPSIIEAMDVVTPYNTAIKAAFEMALWDIVGKVAGQPVYRLLGAYRDSIETDLTIYLDTPEAMARAARDAVAQGFSIVKVKLGQAPSLDVERMHAVRAAVGPAFPLRIDANQGWSATGAVTALRALEPVGIEFCEQPVPAREWAGMRFIRSKVGIPIMADEGVHGPGDAVEGIRQNGMDLINIKLMKSGGILHGAQIAMIAAAANLSCMVGSTSETRVSLTAAVHVVMSQRGVRYADLDAPLGAAVDPVIGGMQIEKGIVRLPDAPGLGVEVDPAFLAKQTR